MSLHEETLQEIVEANIELLSEMKQGLDKKISGTRNHDSIISFFGKMEQVLKSMERMSPSDAVLLNGVHESSRKDEMFLYNLQRLLEVIPQEYKNTTMEQIPAYFRKSIDKIVAYLNGDTDWLTIRHPLAISSSLEESGLKLTVETTETTTLESEHREEILSGQPNKADHSRKEVSLDYGYLIEYKDISKKKEITHILDPLFQLLYPQKTMVSSMKHCKEATGKTLGFVSKTKLGAEEAGSRFLYKIITDKALTRIFGDDRIIATLEESIYIPLLKAIINTAVYRLRKNPKKFPVIGGVSYFVELEDEMLGTTLIRDALIDLIVTRTGSRVIFQPASSRERGGLELMLKNNPALSKRIVQELLHAPDRAYSVTDFWTLKFSCMLARQAGVQPNDLRILFSSETVSDITKFISSSK
jgi:hypothetical protein